MTPEQRDTIKLLTTLLEAAKAGEIDGVAAVCLVSAQPGGHWRNVVGSAVSNAPLTLGAVQLLSFDLADHYRKTERVAERKASRTDLE